jgi:hypothetical protein
MQKRLYATLVAAALCILAGCRGRDASSAYIRLNTEAGGFFDMANVKMSCTVNGVKIPAGKAYIAVKPNGRLDTMLMTVSTGGNDLGPTVNLMRLQAGRRYEVWVNGLAMYYLYNIQEEGREGSPLGAVRFYHNGSAGMKLALENMCDTLAAGDTSAYYKDAPPLFLGKTGYTFRFIDAKADTVQADCFFHFLHNEKMLCIYNAKAKTMQLTCEGSLSEKDKVVTRTNCRFER